MRRFFFENEIGVDNIVELPESEARHISKVLRLSAGEEVELLDGMGKVYAAVLIETGKHVRARIDAIRVKSDEASLTSLIVGQGQLKGQKMDVVVQKCTELGVARVVPLWSCRCQGKPHDLQGLKKHERYQRIVEAACKQCLRPDLMAVDSPCEFSDFLAAYPHQEDRHRLLFWEEERQVSLHDLVIPDTARQVIMILGPEGGFTVEEAENARSQGWQTVSLGQRILRAETATLSAVSIVQFLSGNI